MNNTFICSIDSALSKSGGTMFVQRCLLQLLKPITYSACSATPATMEMKMEKKTTFKSVIISSISGMKTLLNKQLQIVTPVEPMEADVRDLVYVSIWH